MSTQSAKIQAYLLELAREKSDHAERAMLPNRPNGGAYARQQTAIAKELQELAAGMDTLQDEIIAEEMRQRFPWLDTGETEVSGTDTIESLQAWYDSVN